MRRRQSLLPIYLRLAFVDVRLPAALLMMRALTYGSHVMALDFIMRAAGGAVFRLRPPIWFLAVTISRFHAACQPAFTALPQPLARHAKIFAAAIRFVARSAMRLATPRTLSLPTAYAVYVFAMLMKDSVRRRRYSRCRANIFAAAVKRSRQRKCHQYYTSSGTGRVHIMYVSFTGYCRPAEYAATLPPAPPPLSTLFQGQRRIVCVNSCSK